MDGTGRHAPPGRARAASWRPTPTQGTAAPRPLPARTPWSQGDPCGEAGLGAGAPEEVLAGPRRTVAARLSPGWHRPGGGPRPGRPGLLLLWSQLCYRAGSCWARLRAGAPWEAGTWQEPWLGLPSLAEPGQRRGEAQAVTGGWGPAQQVPAGDRVHQGALCWEPCLHGDLQPRWTAVLTRQAALTHAKPRGLHRVCPGSHRNISPSLSKDSKCTLRSAVAIWPWELRFKILFLLRVSVSVSHVHDWHGIFL